MKISTDILTCAEYVKKRYAEIENQKISATMEDKEGYTEEEFDAMWYIDEDFELDYERYKQQKIKEFETDIKKINHKNNYSDISKFGFNNFKPFGDKIQPFSKKPITLIYGPNSIGKSSFIHMQAYLRYIFETQSFNLIDTDMFGDEIN